MQISLREFLIDGNFGPLKLRRGIGPDEILAIFGEPSETWPEKGDNAGDESSVDADWQFPLIVSYGDVEFHFAGKDELHTLFVDTFHGRRGTPNAAPAMEFQEASLLRKSTPMETFLDTMKTEAIEIRSVRPHVPAETPPHAFVVTTSGGVEIGFEPDDTDDADTANPVLVLKWFYWAADEKRSD